MVFSSPNVCHIGVFECVFERAKRPAYPFCAGSPTALRLVLDKRWAVQGIQKLPESIRPKLVIFSTNMSREERRFACSSWLFCNVLGVVGIMDI